MERFSTNEINEMIAKALVEWKKDDADIQAFEVLDISINEANKNGIDLVLKLPRDVFDQPYDARPMNLENALEYASGTDDKAIYIDIPAEQNKPNYPKDKQFSLAMDTFDNVLLMYLKIGQHKILGVFYANEIASIEVK